MPPSRKRTRGATRRACLRCGASTDGKAELCLTCLAQASTLIEPPDDRVAQKVKERIQAGNLGGPICPFCKESIDWNNLASIDTEITIYVREKIYYCPTCRAFLGVASWHTEG